MARAGFFAGLLGVCAVAANAAFAASPIDIQRSLETEARQATSGFAGFSAQRGEQLFNARRGDWSCASCHTADPRQPGRHATTAKPIAPLAPAANADRFTNPAKVDKWFRRNCKDVAQRECSAGEKADVLAYLLSLKP